MLEARALSKAFGGVQVTQGVSLTVERGERRVLLGPNGAGKTTLFNLLAGTLQPDSGEILLDGQPITHLPVHKRAQAGLARSYQKNTLFEDLSLHDNLALAAAAGLGKTASVLRDSFRDTQVTQTVEDIATQVALTGHLNQPAGAVSYGLRRQLEVGIALATRPKILLMDEPTSGVGPAMIDGFHRLLTRLPRDLTLLIIEHDMDLAFSVADRITVLNFGEVVFEGTPEATRQSPKVREIYLGEAAPHA